MQSGSNSKQPGKNGRLLLGRQYLSISISSIPYDSAQAKTDQSLVDFNHDRKCCNQVPHPFLHRGWLLPNPSRDYCSPFSIDLSRCLNIPGCHKLDLSSGGSTALTDLISFPGACKSTNPGITYDTYQGSSSQGFPVILNSMNTY